MRPNVLLLGSDDSLLKALRSACADLAEPVEAREFVSVRDSLDWINLTRSKLVFVTIGREYYLSLIQSVRKLQAAVAVVVVGPADSSRWLEAMDAGAHDYCSEPFEGVYLRSILANGLDRREPRPAAPEGA